MSHWYFPFDPTGAEPWGWCALCLFIIVWLLLPAKKNKSNKH